PLALYLGLPFVAVASVAIFVLQRRNLRSSPRSLVAALTACRVFILALLVAVLAGPFVRLETARETRPVFALVFDRSQSMNLAAGPDQPGVSRAKFAHDAVLTARNDLVAPAGRRFDLKVLTFARDITPLGVDADNFTLPEPTSPGGPSSRIGDAI